MGVVTTLLALGALSVAAAVLALVVATDGDTPTPPGPRQPGGVYLEADPDPFALADRAWLSHHGIQP
jgi:hypothetical protein